MNNSHEVKYKIIGDSMPAVEIELDPDEAVVAEAGMMNYFQEGIVFETKLGDGSTPNQGVLSKIFGAAKRMMTNESLFMTHFTNKSENIKHVAFAAPHPGQIMPLDLKALGGTIYCQKDAFLCAALGTKLSISFTKKIGSGLFGQEGFILQSITGDGMAFMQAGGTIIEKELNNETWFLDTGCVVGFTKGIEYDVKATSSIKSLMFGGEGVFLTKLSGTGKIWMQTMPFNRLASKISSVVTNDVILKLKKNRK